MSVQLAQFIHKYLDFWKKSCDQSQMKAQVIGTYIKKMRDQTQTSYTSKKGWGFTKYLSGPARSNQRKLGIYIFKLFEFSPDFLFKMSLFYHKFSSLVAIVKRDMVWQYNNLIKSSLIFLRKNREKSFILSYDSSTGKSYDGFSKKLKTQREQYQVMYQGKGRFKHSRFVLKNMRKLLISS